MISFFWLAGAITALAQASFQGFYSGSMSTGGKLAFYASANDDVTVVVIDPASASFGANNSIKVAGSGQFNGTYSIATITGQIANDGTATGTVAPLGITFTAKRSPGAGSTQALAGYYQGWIFDPNNRMLNAGIMVSNDGIFYLFIQDGANVTEAGYGTIDARGIFSFTDAFGVVANGSIITTAGGNGWNGRYTKPGAGGFTFVVTRKDAAARLINIATRGKVEPGANVLIAGFVIGGSAKTVLIRATGPALANLGIPTGFLPDPNVTLYSGSVAIANNDNWGTNANAAEIVSASARLGAFALTSGSADAALLVRLEPGLYSAVVAGAGTSTGTALIEIYEVP